MPVQTRTSRLSIAKLRKQYSGFWEHIKYYNSVNVKKISCTYVGKSIVYELLNEMILFIVLSDFHDIKGKLCDQNS